MLPDMTRILSSEPEYADDNKELAQRELLLHSQNNLIELYKNEISKQKIEIMDMKERQHKELLDRERGLRLEFQKERDRIEVEQAARDISEVAKHETREIQVKAKYENKLKELLKSVIASKDSYENKKISMEASLHELRLELSTQQARADAREKALREELNLKDNRITEMKTVLELNLKQIEDELRYSKENCTQLALLVIQLCATAKSISLPASSSPGQMDTGNQLLGTRESIVLNEYLSQALKISKVRTESIDIYYKFIIHVTIYRKLLNEASNKTNKNIKNN